MSELPVLEPTAEHPITIAPTAGRVLVRVDGEIIADTTDAVALREADYPAVQYIPLTDVVADRLTATESATYCPYKGWAGYYSVTTAAGATVADAVWTYRDPYPAVAAIGGRVAFYPDKADIRVDS